MDASLMAAARAKYASTTGWICLAPAGSAGAAVPPGGRRRDGRGGGDLRLEHGARLASAAHTGLSSSAKIGSLGPSIFVVDVARLRRRRRSAAAGSLRVARPAAARALPAASVSSRRAASTSNLRSAATTCDTRRIADPDDATEGGSFAAAAAAAASASASFAPIVCAVLPADAVNRTDSRLATASSILDLTCAESAEASASRLAGATSANARHTSAALA